MWYHFPIYRYFSIRVSQNPCCRKAAYWPNWNCGYYCYNAINWICQRKAAAWQAVITVKYHCYGHKMYFVLYVYRIYRKSECTIKWELKKSAQFSINFFHCFYLFSSLWYFERTSQLCIWPSNKHLKALLNPCTVCAFSKCSVKIIAC